jgi:conjugal transfer pilus assembly protein TraW
MNIESAKSNLIRKQVYPFSQFSQGLSRKDLFLPQGRILTLLIHATKTLVWCHSLTFWLVLILCFSNPIFAKDLKTVGPLYEIKETDILSWIEERLINLQKEEGFKKMEQEMTERATAYVKRPTPVQGIHQTTKPRRFRYDPTIIVSEDLKDAKGNIFHHQGDKVNPLETFTLERPLLFINADDTAQLQWALAFEEQKNQESTLILVQGPVFELMTELKRPLYFDQGGWLVQKLGIQQVPAWVSQEGQTLMVEEVKID